MRALLLALLLLPSVAAAQTASLVADSVAIEADDTLVAEGDVEVLYEGTRLKAKRVVFDRRRDRLTIEGPITVVEAGGEAILVAEQAALDRDLRAGILRSARLVLDRQLQLAAAEVVRAGDRYTALRNVVASSCQVCPGSPTPLWEIRARRVVHDELERQIYFEGAQFRVAGVPLVYLPRLRLPDPTVERATGLLVPRLRFSSDLGAGIKVPYFIVLGRSADLTLGPYLAASTRTLEFRYRQAFRSGLVGIEGAVSDDDLRDASRGYVFAEGAFDLPAGFLLSFDIEQASDDDYLLDYGYSDASRLTNEVRLVRARRDELVRAGLTGFEVLRAGPRTEEEILLQSYGRAAHERRFDVARLGEFRLGLDAADVRRGQGGGGAGRDVARLGATAGWQADRLVGRGVVLEGQAELGLDAYAVRNDPAFDGSITRSFARAGLTLRWPLTRARGAATETLQPLLQLAWADASDADVPNEDSRLVEFDEGNLLALDRFPGRDRVEEGVHLNVGLDWSRLGPESRIGVTAGRVLRFGGKDQFGAGTGLDGAASDWLAALHLELGDRLSLTNRAIVDDDLSPTRNELRLAWAADETALAASHVWLEDDPLEGETGDVNEVVFDLATALSRRWRGQLEGRYSLSTGEADRARLGLTWQNECLQVDLSLSRRFTSSSSVDTSTDFGLEVSLLGFGAGDGRRTRRTCPG